MPAALLTGHVYGYEQIFAVSGLRRNGPNAQLARLKPDRTDPNGFPYPLEIHVHEDKVHLVGFVERRHRHFADPTTTGDCLLWMRRTKGADTLITLALLHKSSRRCHLEIVPMLLRITYSDWL